MILPSTASTPTGRSCPDRRNNHPPDAISSDRQVESKSARCPQPPFHSYLKRYGLHTPADYTLPFPFILALLLPQAFLHTLVRLSSEQCHRLIKILTPVRRTVTGHITLSMPFLHMIIPSFLIHHHNTLIRQPSAQVISTLLIPSNRQTCGSQQKPPSSMRRHRKGTLPSYIFT